MILNTFIKWIYNIDIGMKWMIKNDINIYKNPYEKRYKIMKNGMYKRVNILI